MIPPFHRCLPPFLSSDVQTQFIPRGSLATAVEHHPQTPGENAPRPFPEIIRKTVTAILSNSHTISVCSPIHLCPPASFIAKISHSPPFPISPSGSDDGSSFFSPLSSSLPTQFHHQRHSTPNSASSQTHAIETMSGLFILPAMQRHV